MGAPTTASEAHKALARTEVRIDGGEGHLQCPCDGYAPFATRAGGSLANDESWRNASARKFVIKESRVRLVTLRTGLDIPASVHVPTMAQCEHGSSMTLTAERISELREKGRRAAVATLVATTGGAIRRLGETMWVDDHGAIVGSVTIGGCVDGRAVELAEEALRTGNCQRASLPLGDEDAWAFGMTCAGNVELLVEPVDVTVQSDPVAAAADAIRDAVRNGQSAVEVAAIGDHPHRLVVVDDGTRVGSLGNASLDAEIAGRANALMDARMTGLITVRSESRDTELFVQVHAPLPELIVIGATDVAVALAQLADPLGFNTTVIDGRDRWASRERFPTATTLLVGMPSELFADLRLSPATAVVLVSHDFKYDLPVLEIALRTRAGYVGVLGSRRRANAIREFLVGIGASDDDIARVHVPVGIDIGARTPQEIALSVLAEIISLRRRTPGVA